MSVTTRGAPPMPECRAAWKCVLTFLAAGLLISGTVRADGPKDPVPVNLGSKVLSVPVPLTSTRVNRIKALTASILARSAHQGLYIVYDFNPDDTAASSSEYGLCRDLADYLLKIQDATTVAYVHDEITGHLVLPVLACSEIVMSPKGKIGHANKVPDEAGRAEAPAPQPDQVFFYEGVAGRRAHIPAVVLKMLDRDVELVRGTRAGAAYYIDKRKEAEEVKQKFVPARPEVVVLKAGETALYDATQADKLGLAKHTHLDTVGDVQREYQLPASSLDGDPLEGREPKAFKIAVSGPVTRQLQQALEGRVRRSISRGANQIFFQLDCNGGEATVARDIAEMIRNLKDDAGEYRVMTVAVVTRQAKSTATFLAFACNEIVMEKDAVLGDFEDWVAGNDNHQWAVRDSLVDLAVKRKRPALPVIARGMLDRELAIHRVSSIKGKFRQTRLMDQKELDENKNEWKDDGQIKPPGKWWKLDASLAKELDVAQHVYDGDPGALGDFLKEKYGFDRLEETGADWVEGFAAFLCHPAVSLFLVMIGICGLVLEIKLPGVTLPGVIAALCFVLFFWAHHNQLRGDLTMLAVLLFILGLILIALEVFVLPGLGIMGISGIVLMILGLGLVTLVKKPETTREWMEFGTTLTGLGLSMVGSLAGALIVAWYLPSIPWANRLLLVPPGEEETDLPDELKLQPAYAALLGVIGVAEAPLRPAGKARFGDDFVDVVAEGSYVPEGSRVQVIEVEGNRVVVKEV